MTEGSRRAMAVRAFLPDAQRAWVVDAAHGESRPMQQIHPAGLFEAICPIEEQGKGDLKAAFGFAQPRMNLPTLDYQLRVTNQSGETTTMHDPYAFQPMLTDYDLHLLSEGTHWKSYREARRASADGRRRRRA